MFRNYVKYFTNYKLLRTFILKDFTSLLCLCLIIFLLTGCGNNESIDSTTTETDIEIQEEQDNNEDASVSDDSAATDLDEDSIEVSTDVETNEDDSTDGTSNANETSNSTSNDEEVSTDNSQYSYFKTYTVTGYIVTYDGNTIYWSHEEYMAVNNKAIACIKLDQPITVDDTSTDLLILAIYASSDSDWIFGEDYEGKHFTITGKVTPNNGDPEDLGIKYSIIVESATID